MARLFWLALAAFAIGTESFMITGLLPAISADLGVSVSAAGQFVTAFAFSYAIGSPVLATLFNDVDRKAMLGIALGGFIFGNLLAACAGGYGALMAARILMALSAALCMPAANAVAVAIAPEHQRGRAIAIVSSGLTVATALGVPLGTLIGHATNWRTMFVLVAALGLVALGGLLWGLPRGLPRVTATLSQRLAVARQPSVLRALLVTVLWGTAGFTVFPYLALVLGTVGLDTAGVSLALFLFGSAAAIGNMLGGVLVDRIGAPRTSAIALTGVMTALMLVSVILHALPATTAWIALLVVMLPWGISGWAFHPAQSAKLVALVPTAPMIALSLNASAMYLGFALGSLNGGLVVSALSVQDLGWAGGDFAAAGLALLVAFGGFRQTLGQQIPG
ncbi:MFS transporter [Bradyrhizobium sp. 2TAF24]|uniref:MFS transporter n=1 Tax=Bradyrhizobium sp. 2TAF24 TaxID=3233011 RepID=UPI003F914ABF